MYGIYCDIKEMSEFFILSYVFQLNYIDIDVWNGEIE